MAATAETPAPRPFAFVGEGHMGRLLAELADSVASDAEASELLRGGPGSRTRVTADLSTRTRSNGHLRLRRFYWSAQRWRDDRTPGFAARTLSYHGKGGGAAWYSFPDDPDLPSAGRVLARARGPQVLRYVPLRGCGSPAPQWPPARSRSGSRRRAVSGWRIACSCRASATAIRWLTP